MSDETTALTPAVRTTAEAYGPHFYPHILEQYKLAVQRAETTADRRESGNKLFFVVLTGVAGLYGIGFGSDLNALLPLLGSYICVGWLTFIWARHRLNIATFIVIREIEQNLPVRLFDAERERRYAGVPRRRQISPVSWWELVMPLLFAMFFLLLLIENMMQQSGVNPGTSG
jgi:hypothetical protein